MTTTLVETLAQKKFLDVRSPRVVVFCYYINIFMWFLKLDKVEYKIEIQLGQF